MWTCPFSRSYNRGYLHKKSHVCSLLWNNADVRSSKFVESINKLFFISAKKKWNSEQLWVTKPHRTKNTEGGNVRRLRAQLKRATAPLWDACRSPYVQVIMESINGRWTVERWFRNRYIDFYWSASYNERGNFGSSVWATEIGTELKPWTPEPQILKSRKVRKT